MKSQRVFFLMPLLLLVAVFLLFNKCAECKSSCQRIILANCVEPNGLTYAGPDRHTNFYGY